MKESSEREEKRKAKEKKIEEMERKKKERMLRSAKEFTEASKELDLIRDRKNPEDRLSSFLQSFNDNKEEQKGADNWQLTSLGITLAASQNSQNIDVSSENPDVFARIAAAAIALRSDHVADEPIFAAFSAANLNPKNPFHWRRLMNAFCWSHFPPERKPGRPSLTDVQYGRLLAECAQIRRAASTTMSDRKVAAVLVKTPRFKAQYGKLSAERVRKALGEARNPDYHRELGMLVLIDIAWERDKNGGFPPWTPEQEAALRKNLIKHHCDQIAAKWTRTRRDT